MNWSRLGTFVLVFFVATAAAAFPFGFIRGFSLARHQAPPSWLPIGQAITVMTAGVLVTALLVRRQNTRPWTHAGLMGLSAGILSYPMNVLWLGVSVSVWLASLLAICVMIVLGVPLGFLFRSDKSGTIR